MQKRVWPLPPTTALYSYHFSSPQMVEYATWLHDPRINELVIYIETIPPRADQTRMTKHREMLRNVCLRDAERAHHLFDRPFAVFDHVQYLEPLRIGEEPIDTCITFIRRSWKGRFHSCETS